MKKKSSRATQVTFNLSDAEIREIVLDRLSDKGQVVGDDTSFKFQPSGACTIITMYYGIKSEVKHDTIDIQG